MNVLMNHCWCSKSIWGGHYDCRVIVSIHRVPEGKTYYDPPDPDWVNLIFADDMKNIYRMKPEVQQWLADNVADAEGEKGWAIGTDEYNANDRVSFCVFFKKRNDAMKFIKRWSVYKNPVNYLNYFKDIRRKLDFKTLRLKRAKR